MLKFTQGHVTPWWDNSFKKLNFINYPLSNVEDIQKWLDEGYGGFTFGGAVFNMKQQLPDYSQPFFKLFDWEHVGISYFRLNTMHAVPMHQDGYPGFIERNRVITLSRIRKCIVFLEDWKSGHYLEVEGTPFVKWSAGDYVIWKYDAEHYAANIGQDPRYTMQITGLGKIDNDF